MAAFVGLEATTSLVIGVAGVAAAGVPERPSLWIAAAGGIAVISALNVVPFRGRFVARFDLAEAPVLLGVATLAPEDFVTALVLGSVAVALLEPGCVHRALNAGANNVLAGVVAAAVASGPLDIASPWSGARLVLAGLAFAAVSWAVTVCVLALGSGIPLRETLAAVPFLVAHTGLAITLGVLAAALSETAWALPLLVVPVAYLLALSGVADHSRVERRRGEIVLAASRSVTEADDLNSVTAALVRAAAEVTGTTVRVAEAPGEWPALSVPLPVPFAPMAYLVADPARQEALRGEPDRRRALETLVAVAAAGAENAALRCRLGEQATTDELTGLGNRRQFNARLEEAVSRARRGRPFAVLFVDLDAFKAINDGFGHAAGDEVLREVAGRLRSAVREEVDEAFRLAGDEFTIIVDDVADDASLGRVAEAVRAAVGSPVVHEGRAIPVSASVGGAVWDTDGHSTRQLLNVADGRMYMTKSA